MILTHLKANLIVKYLIDSPLEFWSRVLVAPSDDKIVVEKTVHVNRWWSCIGRFACDCCCFCWLKALLV